MILTKSDIILAMNSSFAYGLPVPVGYFIKLIRRCEIWLCFCGSGSLWLELTVWHVVMYSRHCCGMMNAMLSL